MQTCVRGVRELADHSWSRMILNGARLTVTMLLGDPGRLLQSFEFFVQYSTARVAHEQDYIFWKNKCNTKLM